MITTGDIARVLRAEVFPQVTDDMVRRDAEADLLKCYPRFGSGRYYPIPEHLPDYFLAKIKPIAGDSTNDIVQSLLRRLGLNFKQLRLIQIA